MRDAKDEIGDRLGVAVLMPPKSNIESFQMLQAVQTHLRDGQVKYFSIGGFSTKVFRHDTKARDQFLTLISPENTNRTGPKDINTFVSQKDVHKGSLGSTITSAITAAGNVSIVRASGFSIKLSKMEMVGINANNELDEFLKENISKLCKDNMHITSELAQIPTIFSGPVDLPLAIVIASVTGMCDIEWTTEYVQEEKMEAGKDGIKGEGTHKLKKRTEEYHVGEGVIGARFAFFHLVKTPRNPTITIRDSFVINNDHQDRLKRLLVGIGTRPFRPVHHRRAAARALFMEEDYEEPLSGTFQDRVERLAEAADGQADGVTFGRGGELEGQARASLQVIWNEEEDDDDEEEGGGWANFEDAWGDLKDDRNYTHSNNILVSGPVETLAALYEQLKNAPIKVLGKLVGNMKPVVEIGLANSLPIIFDQTLSGTMDRASVPGWVLRFGPQGHLILCGVEGSGGNAGIVTAYDETWHVRETVVFIGENEGTKAEQLRAENFLRLDPNHFSAKEAEWENVDISDVSTGTVWALCRHVLALKHHVVEAGTSEMLGQFSSSSPSAIVPALLEPQ